MNEIEKRIATVWSGRPTTADVEATRIADLRAVKSDFDAMNAPIFAMNERFDALAARVSALESASAKCPSAPMPPRARAMPYEADTMPHEAAPSPAAALVERMAEAMHLAVRDILERWVPWSELAEYRRERYRASARAALRVAAEGLLGDVTGAEWEDACARYGVNGQGAITNAVLRARLAAALEACR